MRDKIVRQTGYKRREKERDISAVAIKKKKRSRDEDEKVKRLRISASEKRVIHKPQKEEAKNEEQRVISQKQYDDLLSSFRLFRDDNCGKKVFYPAGNILLLCFFFFFSPSLFSSSLFLEIKFLS